MCYKGYCVEIFLYVNYHDGLFGFCDIDGKQIIPNQYEEVKEFKAESTWVKEKNCWYLIDNKNQKISKISYEKVLLFGKDFSVVKNKKTYYSINNQSGKIIAKTDLKIIEINLESAIILNADNSKSFIDIETFKKNQEKFEDAKLFCEGYAPIKKNNKWGLINSLFIQIVEPQYDQMETVNSSLAKVSYEDKEFFIDTKNNKYLENIKWKYTSASHFGDGNLVIQYKNKKGCMNDFFEIGFLKKLDYLSDFEDGYAIFKKNNKFGIIKSNGRIVIKPIYDEILWKSNDYYFVKRKNQYTYVSIDDKELFKISN